jgi:hypothetical protein
VSFLFFVILTFYIPAARATVPNVLIISIDSFKREPRYPKNFNPTTLPNLDKFTDNGYLFKNCFTQNAWANLSLWISKIPNKVFLQSGYDLIGLGWKIPSLRKISADKDQDLPLDFYMMLPSEPELFDAGLLLLKEKFRIKNAKPFFLDLHLKELHPPLFIEKRINTSLLNQDSRDLLLKYLKQPETFAEKVVLFSILFDEASRQHHSPQVLRAINTLVQKKILPNSILQLRYVNLTLMDNLLDIWKNSKNYNKDLTLMNELYQQRQVFLDKNLKELFSLFGNKELANNTLFIVVSNFGFASMEHDQLFNSVGNYDEFIGTHLFIKPPNAGTLKIIQDQASLKGLGKYIYSLLQAKSSSSSFHDNFHYIFEPTIISSNYNYDLFAIRDNNQWKLLLDLANSRRKLFDLKNDPGEKNDLFQIYPNKAAELETIILKKLINEGIND